MQQGPEGLSRGISFISDTFTIFQQCEMLLKQSGVQQASLLGQTLDPIAIKTEPEAMDDVPFAGDPMLSACTDIPDFNIDEAIMNMS